MPWNKPVVEPPKPEEQPKPPEKTPAELIAESVNAALKPLADQFSSLSQRLEGIEQNVKKPEKSNEPTEVPSVFDNEDAAFATRMTPIVMRQMEFEAKVVRNDIKREYYDAGFGDAWQQFATEIEATLDNSPLVDGSGKPLRGNPDYIRNTVDMIFGRAARKGGVRFGKDKNFFLESASGSSEQGKPNPADGMTDTQRRVFERMGISLEDAKKTMSTLKFVS